MQIAQLEHKRLSGQGVIQIQRGAKNGGSSGNRSANNSAKQLSVNKSVRDLFVDVCLLEHTPYVINLLKI